ncbi:MAG: hypothetical protein ACI4CX_04840, partial [Candidatus Weimeria sp.]
MSFSFKKIIATVLAVSSFFYATPLAASAAEKKTAVSNNTAVANTESSVSANTGSSVSANTGSSVVADTGSAIKVIKVVQATLSAKPVKATVKLTI